MYCRRLHKAQVNATPLPPNTGNVSTLRGENTPINSISGFLSVTDLSSSDASISFMAGSIDIFNFFQTCILF